MCGQVQTMNVIDQVLKLRRPGLPQPFETGVGEHSFSAARVRRE